MHELTPDSARSTSRRGIARLVPRSYLGRASVAVLAALALWGGVSLVAPSARAVTNCTPSAGWGSSRSDLATQVVTLINQHRASLGLRQLAVSSTLTASSQWKSLHMAGYGYFSHDDPAPPVARTAYQRAKDCGYAGSWWGENIAYGYTSAQSVVNGWLGSSGHRANIENPNFSSTGVGVASNASGRLYWTQNFGNDVSGGSTPPPSPPPPSTGDTQKPTTPTGLAVTATAETSVQLRWNASGDNVGVTGYGVYVGSSRTATVAGTSATVSGLQCGRSYSLGVDAVDAAQNRSAIATVTVATAPCPTGGTGGTGTDTVAPTAPTGLATAPFWSSVAMSWRASTDNVGVTAYRLWRGGTLVGTTTTTAATFAGLACGTPYLLGVEAVDAAGNVSARTTTTVTTRAC